MCYSAFVCCVWFAGFIVDKTENYDIPFYMGGIVQVLGGSLIIIAVILKHVMV